MGRFRNGYGQKFINTSQIIQTTFFQKMFLHCKLFIISFCISFSETSLSYNVHTHHDHKPSSAFLSFPVLPQLLFLRRLHGYDTCTVMRGSNRPAGCNFGISQVSIESLQERIGVVFHNKSLLEQALVHRSTVKNNLDSNQRLEFLGDAILGMVVADFLYRSYPHLREGELTAIRKEVVNSQALAKVARMIGLGDWITMTDLEAHTGGRKKESILADATESVIAAVYLDQGLQSASDLVMRWVGEMVEQASSNPDIALAAWRAHGANCVHHPLALKAIELSWHV
jgi:hypothetical protein